MVDTAICLSHMSAIIVAGELLPTSVETQVTRQGSASCRLQATQFPVSHEYDITVTVVDGEDFGRSTRLW